MIIKRAGEIINKDKFGGKAYWINWLYINGYTTPKSIFMSVEKNYTKINQRQIEEYFMDTEYFAVRSSATLEDGEIESKAGHYDTFLNVKKDNLQKAIQGVMDSNIEDDHMGVVVQEMICPITSGVVFSSNPLNGLKNEVIVSLIEGQGDKLVSGYDKGEDLIIYSENDTITLPTYNFPINKMYLEEIVRIAKEIEGVLRFPVDIEWCIDSKSCKLYILQCRPITNLKVVNGSAVVVTNCNIKGIPTYLINSDKIRLRLQAEKLNTHISKAYLIIMNSNSKSEYYKDVIKETNNYCGYSAVIISPNRINGEVIRNFVGDSSRMEDIMNGQLFEIVKRPKYKNLDECLNDYMELVHKYSWSSSIIVQEIYNPMFTGIMKKNGDCFIVEITKGHFASKGIVPMSTYLVDCNSSIIYKNEIEQLDYMGIIEGFTLKIKVPKTESKIVSLSDENILKIIRFFERYFETDNLVVEFGVLNLEHNIMPYLIDCTSEKENIEQLDEESVRLGIISNGVIEGKLVRIEDGEMEDSINMHFYNTSRSQELINHGNYIFVAKRPDIGLMKILNSYNPENIGFIFEAGSMLCHFAVLLREKNIPALVNRNIDNLPYGSTVKLDTNTGKIY